MNGTLLGGWIYNYISPNQYGGESYLWTTLTVTGLGTVYSLYDAETGKLYTANHWGSNLQMANYSPRRRDDRLLHQHHQFQAIHADLLERKPLHSTWLTWE